MRVPKLENHWIPLSSINGSNSGETFWCAQGTNQVLCCSCDAWEMVELHKSDYLVECYQTSATIGEVWETLAKEGSIGKTMYWIHVPIKSWQAW